jgi:GDP-D-mannose 3', 5'-epimerase
MKRAKTLRFAVTGASGFLGSHMVEFLKQKKHWVRAITRKKIKETSHLYRLADEVKYLDISVQKQAYKALEHIDYVFHFAADMGGVGYFSKEQYYPFVTNMLMDLHVLQSCQYNHVKRLFYPSSACIYPVDAVKRLKTAKLKENMLIPANPDQMYGWEKFMITILAPHAPTDVRVGILHTIFGVGQQWQGARAKFPPAIAYKVIEAKKTGTPVHIWGDGKQVRTFLYITDALEKIYEIMMSPKYQGEVNISSDEQVTIKQCVDWLCEFADIRPRYIFEKNKPTGVISRGVDNTKFKRLYSYRNKVTTKEGFRLVFEDLSKRLH